MDRTSGVLMHISSLPNKFGIGSFGASAYQFVDFLHASNQTYWQILPLTTTSFGDSPYQSFSAFAGNTHFIDLDILVSQGILSPSDFEGVDFGKDPLNVDYGKIFHVRKEILEIAVENFLKVGNLEDYVLFLDMNKDWLEPFVEYMAIKEHFGLKSWDLWDEDARMRKPETIQMFRARLHKEMDYHRVTQYLFFNQWHNLKKYANRKNIQIIGDMPIYVASDSVEMWATPEYFKVDANRRPTVVAGTPPDSFSEDGQFWGNPIYDWEYMKADNYSWWVKRLKESFKLYDCVRIDHFRGFESFWEVPYGAKTSAAGYWTKGPGYDLFKVIKQELGDLNIIAEDLGFMTQEVIDMRDATGFPGMKIMQFGFNGYKDSSDLPHHYSKNTVAYVGTHDNETAMGWYNDTANQAQKAQLDAYLSRQPHESPAQALNRGIALSVSQLAIYTMQDLLNLDNSARMNEPATIGKNWKWRMKEGQLTSELTNDLKQLTETYFRVNPNINEEN